MFLTLALLALATPAADAAPVPKAVYQLKLDDYQIDTTSYLFPSGLRILFQEDHTQPIVSITNWFDRGSVYDGANAEGESVEGIAHAVEHLAFRAKHGDLPKNWDVINQLGGVLNASTSREWTNYMTVAPVDAAVPLLRIEALRMHDGVAGVTESDVEQEKSIVRNELRMGYESGANGSAAIRTAFVHVPKLLYPDGHPYRNTTIGSHETIANIDLASVQRYVSENYRPEYATISMVGDFKLAETSNMIFQAFEGVEHLLMAPEDAEKYEAMSDPAERAAFLDQWVEKTLVPFLRDPDQQQGEPRVDCGNKVEPPMELASDEVVKIKGMVENPTVIAAWALPSGYCPDDVNMNIAANMLSNYIGVTLDPDYNPLSQEQEIEGLGCFVDADRRGSVLMCMVEQGALSKDTPERLLDKVADALYMQTQPIDAIFKPFYDQSLTRARLSATSDVLGMTDNVASLYGRSFFVSQHAHYTGSPAFFSETISSYNTMDIEAVRALAGKYVTRDRMARVIIEPMDEEARERLEASASEADKENTVGDEHRAKDDHSRQLFDADQLTPEAIKGVTVVPDIDKARVLNFDNGLEVVIMDHGEAPLVKVGLQVKGSDATAPLYGLDSLAESLFDSAVASNQNPTENPLAVAGLVYRTDDMVYASGSSGNLDALLHKMRWHVEDYDWQMADKRNRLKRWSNTAKGDGEEPETWASRLRYERLFPGHPYGKWLRPADYDAMQAWDAGTLKSWIYTKWQPANARLVIVGKIDDIDEAERLAQDYFSAWAPASGVTPAAVEPPAPPTSQPDRQVLLFDKPIATQSKVQLSCQLAYEGDEHTARTQVLGEALSFLAFERLREEKGLTYGAYAFPRRYWGGTTELIIASVIQNSGVGFGVKTMFDLVQEGADGELADSFIATNKWNVARTSVTQIQSGDQMLSALLSPDRGNLDYYERYPDYLANVTKGEIAEALQPCKGHEIVTVVGPVDQVKPQLDEMGIAYEVIDWEAQYVTQLSKKELKKYEKAKAKEEAERAKKAAEGDE